MTFGPDRERNSTGQYHGEGFPLNSIALPFVNIRNRDYLVILMILLSAITTVVVGFWLGMVCMALTLAISLPDQTLTNQGAKKLYWILPLTVIGLIGVILIYSIFQWIQKPPQWDFFIFLV